MIEEEARVLSVSDGWAIIAVEKTSSCHSCQANQSCGTRSLSDYFRFRPPELKVRNTLAARPGDRVMVSVADSMLLGASLLMYILPLLMMIVPAALIDLWLGAGADEGWQVLAGLGGLAMGIWLVRYLSARFVKDSSVMLVRVLSRSTHPIIFNT